MNDHLSNHDRLQDQLENIWEQLAEQRFSHGAQPQRSPEAILISGQPGSGRATVAERFRKQFAEAGGCVSADPEEIRLLHPAVTVCRELDSECLVEYVNSAAATLAGRLSAKAVSDRCHLVAVCTFDSPEAASALIQFLNSNQYQITVVISVVHPHVCWHRLAQRLPASAPILSGPESPDEHHRALDQLLTVCDHIEQSKNISRVLLLDDNLKQLLKMTAETGFTAGRCRSIFDELTAGHVLIDRPGGPNAAARSTHDGLTAHPSLSRRSLTAEISLPALLTPASKKTTLIDEDTKISRRREWQLGLRRLADAQT